MDTAQQWRCSDDQRIEGEHIAAQAPRAQAVIAPAMGVPRGFYRRFAQYLADRGISVRLFDYRRQPGTQMTDWGRLDIDAAIAACDEDLPIFLLGHSCGGQLAGLAPNARRLAGFIFVAAQSGYWGHWSGRGKLGMWTLGHVLIPLLARGRYFPARRLRLFALDPPASVIAQWGRWIRSPGYLFDATNGLDTGTYTEVRQPALAYGFDDDGYAPPAAIEALMAEYPALSTTRRQLAPADVGGGAVGHMGFFRETMRAALWQPTADWVLQTAAARSGDSQDAHG